MVGAVEKWMVFENSPSKGVCSWIITQFPCEKVTSCLMMILEVMKEQSLFSLDSESRLHILR
jgi:hypothetical protein